MIFVRRLLKECVCVCLRQATSTATEDPKVASAPKINDFRNKFEKFGAPASKVTARKPPIGGTAAAGSGSSGTTAATGSDAIDKASREARELAEQLQQQMKQLEQSRITERQQLVDKLEQRDVQFKTINEKNAAVSYYYCYCYYYN